MNFQVGMVPETVRDETSVTSSSSSVKWLLQNSLLVNSTSTTHWQDVNDLQESSGSTINWLLNKAHITETRSFTDSSGGADGESWIDGGRKKNTLNTSTPKSPPRGNSLGIISTSSQNVFEPITVTCPSKNLPLTLMQQALQKSPYIGHKRQKQRLLREQKMREMVDQDKAKLSAFMTAEKYFPNPKNSPPPSWSFAIPPTSGLFDDVKKETKREQLVKSITSRALRQHGGMQKVIGKSPISNILNNDSIGNMSSAVDRNDMIDIHNTATLNSSITLNELSLEVSQLPDHESELVEPGLISIPNNNNIHKGIHNGQILVSGGEMMPTESVSLLKFLPDIEKIDSTSLYGQSMEAAMNSFISIDIDPLYRIMKEEGERLNDAHRLFTSIPTDRPLASVPESRRKHLILDTLSSEILQPSEAKEVASFDVLPSHLWPTCRLVYFLLLNYHNLLFAGKVVPSNQVKPTFKLDVSVDKKSKPQGSPSKKHSSVVIFSPNSNSKRCLSRQGGRSSPSKSPLSRPNTSGLQSRRTEEKMTKDELSQMADMDMFWSVITQQRRQYGIRMITSLDNFSWIMLKQLLAMPVELCYALHCVESGVGILNGIDLTDNTYTDSANESSNGRDDDFYSAFPEDYMPLLREAARARSLHPSFLAPICAPAARMCSWARRVVAGIFSVKHSMICAPLPMAEKIAILHPLNSAPLDSNSTFDAKSNGGEGVTYVPVSATTGSLLREHRLTLSTPKRLEQIMNYHNNSASASSGDTSFFFVAAIDGSETSHIAFVTAISLARPFDRVDILACQKPRGSDYPAGNISGPVAMNVLKSHYEGLVRGMTNSPSHRVVVLDNLYVSSAVVDIKDSDSILSHDESGNGDDDEKITVSFNSKRSPNEQHQEKQSSTMQNIEWSIHTNETYMYAKGGAEELVTKALQVNADFCVLGFGWGRNILRTGNDSVLDYLNKRHTGKPFALVITSYRNNPISILSTFSSSAKIPSISFSPSRFVICIDDSDSSEAAFTVAKKFARPSDLLFLIHLSIVPPSKSAAEHSINVSKSASVAHSLVQKYISLGHNLHVEPLTIPYTFSNDEMKIVVATQLKQTAALFEPTYFVMGANKRTIDYLACGNNFLSTIAKSSLVSASKLEGDAFDRESKMLANISNPMMPPISVSSALINFEGESDAPAYSYIVVTR